MGESKKRGKKTTADQMAILLDYLEKNRILVTNKSHPMNTGKYYTFSLNIYLQLVSLAET